MAVAVGRTRCVICEKEKATLKCGGCSQDFCFNVLIAHWNELSQQLDEIETNREQFREILNEQMDKPKKHTLIQQIDQWEYQITCWPKGASQGRAVVGSNGAGDQSNQLGYPIGLALDRNDVLSLWKRKNAS